MRFELERITREDLEDSVTQAQYTICLQHLHELKCPVCRQKKEYKQCLCKTCYFAVPEDIRRRLWTDATTTHGLRRFVTAYLEAKDFLRELGREVCA